MNQPRKALKNIGNNTTSDPSYGINRDKKNSFEIFDEKLESQRQQNSTNVAQGIYNSDNTDFSRTEIKSLSTAIGIIRIQSMQIQQLQKKLSFLNIKHNYLTKSATESSGYPPVNKTIPGITTPKKRRLQEDQIINDIENEIYSDKLNQQLYPDTPNRNKKNTIGDVSPFTPPKKIKEKFDSINLDNNYIDKSLEENLNHAEINKQRNSKDTLSSPKSSKNINDNIKQTKLNQNKLDSNSSKLKDSEPAATNNPTSNDEIKYSQPIKEVFTVEHNTFREVISKATKSSMKTLLKEKYNRTSAIKKTLDLYRSESLLPNSSDSDFISDNEINKISSAITSYQIPLTKTCVMSLSALGDQQNLRSADESPLAITQLTMLQSKIESWRDKYQSPPPISSTTTSTTTDKSTSNVNVSNIDNESNFENLREESNKDKIKSEDEPHLL